MSQEWVKNIVKALKQSGYTDFEIKKYILKMALRLINSSHHSVCPVFFRAFNEIIMSKGHPKSVAIWFTVKNMDYPTWTEEDLNYLVGDLGKKFKTLQGFCNAFVTR